MREQVDVFVVEHSLVICVMWPSTLVPLCIKFGQNSCMLVVSLPLEALHYQHFQIWLQRVSVHVIPLYGGVSKSNGTPCI